MAAPDIQALPTGYRRLLELAQERFQVEILLLDELKGGRTGALLYLVSLAPVDGAGPVRHLILKLDHVPQRGAPDEIEQHKRVLSLAPPDFARRHIAEVAYELVKGEQMAVFYAIAGQSLLQFRPLAAYTRQSQLETLFRATEELLLTGWNAPPAFDRGIHPKALLERWLSYRLKPGGRISEFLEQRCRIDSSIAGFLIRGEVYPNPLAFGRDPALWGKARPIDALTGCQHGDLNTHNILARFAADGRELSGCYLIDFALFKSGMPLFFDQRYLEMSYLIDELEKAGLDPWVELVTDYAREDTPDPQHVSVGLAGACAALNAGRRAFGEWVAAEHASLCDDLWGQFWLAGAAGGLNFCNKQGAQDRERLAGMVYAAAHLKRFCTQFGIGLPGDVRLLYQDARAWEAARLPGRADPSLAIRREAGSPMDSLRVTGAPDSATQPSGTATFPFTDIVGQMAGSDLRRQFPSARQDAIPNNLPVQLTSFIGREREIAEVSGLLPTTRLLTLTGSGGAGKTRLSLEVAAVVLDSFKDGVWFVELAPLTDPYLIAHTVAGAMGLREEQGRPLMDSLLAHLRDRELLLILDNCEHLVESCARFADAVLRAGRQARILASSREALGVAGELAWRVPSLATPDPKGALPAAQLQEYAGVQLFIARASYAQPAFRLTDANAPAVAQICWRLDGMPLAIELAAARVRAMSAEQIAARLDDRFRLLTAGGRTVLPRHQTLRAAVDWSYDMLAGEERVLFRRLAVFAGGWTLEAAESVCANQNPAQLHSASSENNATLSGLAGQVSMQRGSSEESHDFAGRDSSLSRLSDGALGTELLTPSRPGPGSGGMTPESHTDPVLDPADVLDLLCRLVDKSLVIADCGAPPPCPPVSPPATGNSPAASEPYGDETRYRMLETIREYALAKLREAGEEETVRDRHQRTFLAIALSRTGQPIEQVPRRAPRVDVEHDNFRAALGWLLEREDSEPALALCNALYGYSVGKDFSEARSWYGRAIDASRHAQARQQVSGSHRSAYSQALDHCGTIATWQGDYVTAREALTEALVVKRELDDKAGVASVLISLGILAWYQDDAPAARAAWEESLGLYRVLDRELGQFGQSPYVLSLLAQLARESGDYGESEGLSRESLALARALGNKAIASSALLALGWLAVIAGDYATSQTFADESMALRRELDFEFGLAQCYTQRGYLAWHLGDYGGARAALEQALVLFGKQQISSFSTCPCLTGVAAVDVSEGRLARGVTLLGAIATESERTGRSNKDIALRVYEQTLAAARAQMDPAAFDAAWAAGRALTLARAIELASRN